LVAGNGFLTLQQFLPHTCGKWRRVRLAWHVARMRRGLMHVGYWWEIQKDVIGWIILKIDLK
jgi:hypothetical protein